MRSLILSTIKNAKEEFAHYGESVIDLAVDDEAWESVPLVDQAIKLLTIKDIYKKNKLKRNYQSFIEAVKIMDKNEIDKYFNILNENGSLLSEEVTETIFDIITESEKPLKTKILGNLSVALSRCEINLDDYYTLALIIQVGSIPALNAILSFMEESNFKGHINSAGNIDEEGLLVSLGIALRFGTGFRLDKRGMKLAEFGLNIKIAR